ncbi:MAG: metallophosphoesterase [Candidatus Promineifilaceae bacterium]
MDIMFMLEAPLYFVQISDTHIGPTADYSRDSHYSLPCAKRIVEVINTLPTRPDFVIHTGDVVTNPHPVSYQLAAETFAGLEVPIYYVTGNHDRSADIRHYLPMGPKVDAGRDPSRLSYTFEVKGFRFLVLDARGPDEIDPQGLLSDSDLELLAEEATPTGPPLIVFVHFPALPLNSPWMDGNMLIQNGEAMHEALLPARSRLRGVFHGHIHQPMQIVRDGILYVSSASAFSQFGAWPGNTDPFYDPAHDPGYNFVHLLNHQTVIHQHTFPRP